jgi:Tfp pilus assembly protein PilX
MKSIANKLIDDSQYLARLRPGRGFVYLLRGTWARLYSDDSGIATAIALLLLAVLTLLGTTAVVFTSTDIQISGNYKVSEATFFGAEGGLEEARGRLRGNAPSTAKITDTHPTSTQWRAYIGPLAMAQSKGFNPSLATHSRTDSLQSSMTYVIEIKHRTDASGNILYWGDHNEDGVITRNTAAGNSNNRNIYLVTSYGYKANSYRVVEAEMSKVPPITVPAPLYVKANATIQGTSTDIIGIDMCGSSDKPGIITTNNPGSITINGDPSITGTGGSNPNIVYNGVNLDIDAMVNSLKDLANYSYSVNSETHTGMNWGTPTSGGSLELPSTCNVHNIVYYNTNGTDIRLAGGSSGCGILLIEGDFEAHGSFYWHGIVLVTGSVKYLGGGDKQITGGMLSGGTVDADVIGGNANIIYCSTAVQNQTEHMPLRSHSWREVSQ